MEDLKIKKQKAKLYNIVKSYYSILDDLAARLQKDYAGGDDHIPFEQCEEDRLAICFILDYFDGLKEDIEILKKKGVNKNGR